MPPARYHVHQRPTLWQNRYLVLEDDDGQPGGTAAYVEQKRVALKESFTAWAYESQHDVVFTAEADRRLDVRSTMTVRDPAGEVIGALRKQAGASLLRSTWLLEQPGLPPVLVRERSAGIALLRRVWDLVPFLGSVPVPWVFHFDGTLPDGRVALTHERRWGLRDRYLLDVHEPGLDHRLAMALAVCLDALQGR